MRGEGKLGVWSFGNVVLAFRTANLVEVLIVFEPGFWLCNKQLI